MLIQSRGLNKLNTSIFFIVGGFVSAACPHGVVYGFKSVLTAESVRDHVDILLSLRHQPTIVISDMAGMVAAHGNKRKKDMFQPNEGRLAAATEANLTRMEAEDLTVNMPQLVSSLARVHDERVKHDHGYSEVIHPVTRMREKFSISDEFHKKNVSSRKDKLRDLSLVPELSGWVNTQIKEQLYSSVKKDIYFLDGLSPSKYMFVLRLLLDLHNLAQNSALRLNLDKVKPEGSVLVETNDGRTHYAMTTQYQEVTPAQGEPDAPDVTGRLLCIPPT